MRTTFINTLSEMAREDEKIMCVIGDTGFSVFEDFEKEFGPRFVNVGIAEQNFVSFGAGLAAMGLKPYIYNVASFMTLRGMEQIFLDICYQENPVVLVGVGGGLAYSTAGPTHHAIHDIAMMSEIPNLTVVCPGDPVEMKALMLETRNYNKPIYIRIGRSVDPVVHSGSINFKIGKAIKMKSGDEATLYVTGVMLKVAVEAQQILSSRGLSVGLVSMPTIKPLDESLIIDDILKGRFIYTLEEHSILGGLGDAVGRVILSNLQNSAKGFKKFAIEDEFVPVTGSREYLDSIYGLSPEAIANKIEDDLRDKK